MRFEVERIQKADRATDANAAIVSELPVGTPVYVTKMLIQKKEFSVLLIC